MKIRPMLFALVAASTATLVGASASFASTSWKDPGQSRQATRDMVEQTIDRLYSLEPSARRAIRQSGYYAVFDIAADGSGRGMVVEESIREETLMGVSGSQPATPGGYRQVWVFKTPEAYREFIAHGHAFADGTRLEPNLALGAPWPPGALRVADDVTLYHITNEGLVMDLTMPASAYRRNIAFDRTGRL
ncbi:hypothetical protein [Arenimonas daejeonensis]|uniref:hypothetical protein n=1 Tax=Arenimonas daejeonensis TaxID=370777 RepID=UPI0011BD8A5C|nr:hypothetical protein [Arenimonas daejeonensis]